MQETTNQPYFEEDDIDIMELIAKLWKKKTMIIKWCIAGAVIGLIAGFSIPKTYKASVTIAPEQQQRTNSSVSSIASMMGVNLNNSVDAISVDMFPDVVHSIPFIVELFDLPVTFERKDSVITTTLVDYMKEYQRSPWWNSVINAPFKALGWLMSIGNEKKDEAYTAVLDPSNLPKKERQVVKYFNENLLVNVDKKSGKTSMSLTMQDPRVVASVMNAVTENLKAYMSDYRTSKARQDVENLEVICALRKADYYKAQQTYADFVDANKNVIRQSANAERDRLQQEMNLAYQVYSQVATNLEGARIQAEQAKPIFVIIDPVTVPLKKAAPSKARLLLVFTFLAGCCAAAWVLIGEEYWIRLKGNL
ncbi:MAG: chain-length determining protein [Bacteroidales bacterium]|nr:chain-length determining protein [Bacteroidales bacterium]